MLYNAPILAGLPSSSVQDYLQSALRLRELGVGVRIISGHYGPVVVPGKSDELVGVLEKALGPPAASAGSRSALPFETFRYGSTTLITGRKALRRPQRRGP